MKSTRNDNKKRALRESSRTEWRVGDDASVATESSAFFSSACACCNAITRQGREGGRGREDGIQVREEPLTLMSSIQQSKSDLNCETTCEWRIITTTNSNSNNNSKSNSNPNSMSATPLRATRAQGWWRLSW